MVNFALADNGSAIVQGVSVTPCGVTTLEALAYFGEPVTISELMAQHGELFGYSSWYLHLRSLEVKGLVARSEVVSVRKRKLRVKWQVTSLARKFIELVTKSVG